MGMVVKWNFNVHLLHILLVFPVFIKADGNNGLMKISLCVPFRVFKCMKALFASCLWLTISSYIFMAMFSSIFSLMIQMHGMLFASTLIGEDSCGLA
jgi:hypothetical protein